jgi:tRNA(Ile)-lysidine synthase
MKSDNLIKKVSFVCKKYDLLKNNDICLLAVSGGIDSVFLFHIFLHLKDIFKLNISVAHVNYKLRSNDSDLDEEFVTSLCNKYSIPLFKKISPIGIEKSELEKKARNIRYSFFEEICLKNNINKIVLAHNSNDLLETIIMKLIRGSISSLYGMSIKRKLSDTSNIEIIRPILCVSREEIEKFVIKNNIAYREDYTNNKLDFTRNRIRIKILPKIIEENKNILSTLFYKSEIISNENNYLNKITFDYINNSILIKENNHIVLSNREFSKIPDELKSRTIKNTFTLLRDDNFSFDSEIINSVNECIKKNQSNKIIKAKNNFFFLKDRDYLIFSKDYKILEINQFEYKIIDYLFLKELNINVKIFNNDKELTIKNYSKNQIFQNKKLKEFFDKKKIPEYERRKIFLILDKNEIIYIHGFYNKKNLNLLVF